MVDEKWFGIEIPCQYCDMRFPRLLRVSWSSRGSVRLEFECGICLSEFSWTATRKDQRGVIERAFEEWEDLTYGNMVGDFNAWEDELDCDNNPDCGIQLEFPDMY